MAPGPGPDISGIMEGEVDQRVSLSNQQPRAGMGLFSRTSSEHQSGRPIKLDERLIDRIGKDDKQAFQEFYERVNAVLFAYILSLVKDQHDAEELLQETYLKIRSAAHLYQPQGKPMAWVFTIARNLSLMRLRQRSRISDQTLDEMENLPGLVAGSHAETTGTLETALRELDETERSIVLLHAVGGYKHREIAENLAVPLATVLSKYQRSIKKLRTLLEHL